MAHYAYLDENNVVQGVFVGKDEHEVVEGISDWEVYYGAKRTSYNTIGGVHTNGGTPFRKNYAGIGYTYDPVRDAFIPPKPFDSWLLNEDSCLWEAPVAHPNDGKFYAWDEESLTWKEVVIDD
jgi:hypothetical protein